MACQPLPVALPESAPALHRSCSDEDKSSLRPNFRTDCRLGYLYGSRKRRRNHVQAATTKNDRLVAVSPRRAVARRLVEIGLGRRNNRVEKGVNVLNFIELHYDNAGIAVIININKIISYERIPGRSYTDLLLEREGMTVQETPAEISKLIVAAQAG
jgi:hypothetical protein